jgi:putative ABC transport system substrate-binding protein
MAAAYYGQRMNNRRKLLIALGAGALAAPLGSFAQQQGKVWRVGILSARRSPVSLDSDYYGAFPRRMSELGYVEGRNLIIEWRFADGEYERLPGMAAELVKLKADVILALGPPGAVAAQKATSTIPIVFVVSTDPVAAGLVMSLARPGGNITGLSNLAGDLSSKHLEMLLTLVPKLSRVAILLNPANSAHAAVLKNLQSAAQKAGIKALPVTAQTPQEIETAFSTMVRENAGAVMVALDPLFIQQVTQIAVHATKHHLPSIFANREYAEAGGLMSYGQNQVDIYRRAAGYVDRIFKGGKPGDLPVEQPTKLELLINRKAAKALGLTVPQSLLVRADEVIQ